MNMNINAASEQQGGFSLMAGGHDVLEDIMRKHDTREVKAAPTNAELSGQKRADEEAAFAAFFGISSNDAVQVDMINDVVKDLVQESIKSEENVASLTVEEAVKRFDTIGDGDTFDVNGISFTPHENKDVILEAKTSETRREQFAYLHEDKHATTQGASASRTGSSATSSTSSYNTTRQTSDTTQKTTADASRRTTRRAVDQFDEMNKSVKRLAVQRVPGWNRPAPEEDEFVARSMKRAKWHKRLIYQTKRFFKGGKGRITIKLGVAMGLQFAMGIVGKRYQFDNAGQMGMMFSLMLASFFITRELAEDGIDANGLSF